MWTSRTPLSKVGKTKKQNTMDNTTKLVIAAVLGLGGGFLAGYLIAKHKAKGAPAPAAEPKK